MKRANLILLSLLVMLSSSCGTFHARLTDERVFYGERVDKGPYPATRIESICLREGHYFGGDPRGLIIMIPLVAAFFVVDAVTDTIFLYWDKKAGEAPPEKVEEPEELNLMPLPEPSRR